MSDYYVSPGGTGTGATTSDPAGDWLATISGTGRTNVAGDRIIFKSGTYTDLKAGTPWNKKVVIAGVVGTSPSPIYIMGEDGGHAILDLFFDVNSGAAGSAYIRFVNLHFQDSHAKIDPAIIDEGSNPAQLFDWGTGITLGDAPGCKIYHCVVEGGGQAMSAFQAADDAYFGYNVTFDYGWYNELGTALRAHGHGIYLANTATDGTKTVVGNILGPNYYATTKAGSSGVHIFSTTDRTENIELTKNISHGGVYAVSYDFPEDGMVMDGNWISSPLIGTASAYDANGVAFGYANNKDFTTAFATDANQINFSGSGYSNNALVAVWTDGTLPGGLTAATPYYVVNEDSGTVELSLTLGGSPVTLTSNGTGTHTMAHLSLTGSFVDNKVFHCGLRVTNGIWDDLTTSGITIYKTRTEWYQTDEGLYPALAFDEQATFSDISAGGTSDTARIDISPWDTNRAHLSIADLNLNGVVDVSTILGTFLTTGDTYEVYHFRDIFITPVASGTWAGSLSLDIVETIGIDNGTIVSQVPSPIDSFVVFKSTGTPSAPVITSLLTASGQEDVAFSYSITATNSPTSYGATGLPAGLTRSGNIISGAPTVNGVSNVTISATNAGGADSQTLVLTLAAAATGGGSSGGAISSQREMSGGLLTATQSDTVAPILLYSASFPDIDVFGWTGYGALSWANQTWTGYGDLIMIDPVQETTDSAADSLSFTMSGLDGEYYTAILLGDYHGRAAKVWVGALDLTTGQLVDDPYLLFSGVLDSDVIKDTGTSATLRMTLINDVSDQLRARSWQYTHEDQQSLYPGVVDNGLEFVAALQDVEIG